MNGSALRYKATYLLLTMENIYLITILLLLSLSLSALFIENKGK